MKSIANRVNFVLGNEIGASSLEYIVIISLVIGVCTALFFFTDDVALLMGKNVEKASYIGWEN